MILRRLIAPSLKVKRIEGDINREVRGIAYHSSQVNPDYLFVCIPGFETDGHFYVDQAIQAGACGVVVEKWQSLPLGVTQVQVPNSRKALAILASLFFDNPTSKFKLVGITGTNGKTTTAYLTESVFSIADHRTGLAGTVEYRIGTKVFSVSKTTPESLELQSLFHRMVQAGVSLGVMEVSSHGIDLHRVDACQFDVLVFTNLGQDHLDYHESLERYAQTKLKLFEGELGEKALPVINGDDPWGRKIALISKKEKYLYGLDANSGLDLKAERIKLKQEGSTFRLLTPIGSVDICLPLSGKFNIYNALAASGVGLALGLSLEDIKYGLEKVLKIPGRFERIDAGQDFTVVVDYAHTPDGLAKVLEAARGITEKRIITLFGCGGNRDKAKRPLMGNTAARLSDYCIITTDNPRKENPEEIMGQIETGVEKVEDKLSCPYLKIVNRKEAIKKAISLAEKGDLVLIAGKGHETTQDFGSHTLPFDDRLEVRKVLGEKLNASLKSG